MRIRLATPGRALIVLLAAGTLAATGVAALAFYGPLPNRGAAPAEAADASQSVTREFTVHARKYAFDPSRIEVQKDDLVKITFHADDIPHSFTLDAYRIAKRAAPDAPVVFEFRADQAGRFPYYCRLTIDDGCREMKGELVVYAR